MASSETFYVAVYASIVATAALLLNFKSWLDGGVRLKLSLMQDAVIVSGFAGSDEKGLMALTVTNRGDQTTTLTHLVILRFGSLWKRIRVKPSESYLIPNPQIGGTGSIPSELEPGKYWIGIARKRLDQIADLESGKCYMGVYVSTRDKPYLVRITKPKQQLPENTKTLA